MERGIQVKKRYILPIVGAIASVGVGYMMKNKKGQEETTLIDTLTNAGMPDQVDSYDHDQLENAKMVSEGSQFGVQYFNENAEEIMQDLDNKITE